MSFQSTFAAVILNGWLMELRNSIIDEAIRIITMYGLKALRMDDIASNLGVSKRTIYEIFGDKETLITEALIKSSEGERPKKRIEMETCADMVEEFMCMLKDRDTALEVQYKRLS